MQLYTVKSGDTLGTIARTYMGSSTKWKELWLANADTISNPDVIHAGQVIKIPGGNLDLPTQSYVPPALTASRPAYEPTIPTIKPDSFMDTIKKAFKNKTVMYAGAGMIGLLAILFIVKKK